MNTHSSSSQDLPPIVWFELLKFDQIASLILKSALKKEMPRQIFRMLSAFKMFLTAEGSQVEKDYRHFQETQTEVLKKVFPPEKQLEWAFQLKRFDLVLFLFSTQPLSLHTELNANHFQEGLSQLFNGSQFDTYQLLKALEKDHNQDDLHHQTIMSLLFDHLPTFKKAFKHHPVSLLSPLPHKLPWLMNSQEDIEIHFSPSWSQVDLAPLSVAFFQKNWNVADWLWQQQAVQSDQRSLDDGLFAFYASDNDRNLKKIQDWVPILLEKGANPIKKYGEKGYSALDKMFYNCPPLTVEAKEKLRPFVESFKFMKKEQQEDVFEFWCEVLSFSLRQENNANISIDSLMWIIKSYLKDKDTSADFFQKTIEVAFKANQGMFYEKKSWSRLISRSLPLISPDSISISHLSQGLLKVVQELKEEGKKINLDKWLKETNKQKFFSFFPPDKHLLLSTWFDGLNKWHEKNVENFKEQNIESLELFLNMPLTCEKKVKIRL